MRVCPQCQRDRLVNNGAAAGKPKQRCQPCGSQLTRIIPRGQPLNTKSNAVPLPEWHVHASPGVPRAGLSPVGAHLDQGCCGTVR
jgi:transposase-like protein